MQDDSSSTTSATLLERVGREDCDQEAWARFTVKYGARILAWCRRWGLQTADAEDVTQDVLVRLCKQLRSFEYNPDKKFRGWLKSVARGAWADFVTNRNRAGLGSAAVMEQLQSMPAGDDFVEQIGKTYEEELFDSAQKLVRPRVQPHIWEAFALNQLQGLPAGEVAERLGMNVGAVYQAVYRVKNMVKEEVERLQDEDSKEPP